ncbi:MAG TPA: selenocysteine-specific translation elongation factor, partial [Candidatus Dormibacteraeota bacterium]|nr:selenocysteine-specific translation elongation factor [Candidatus Dormibacteraeota bacterium]
MSIVIGTAGHIDHGKTALLRALTGIDADRLPEEQRRGMTIDIGYAWLPLPEGGSIDFVDVPGHDRLIGNMLVGAGEIDAVMLVVAADDGPRAQTLEHLELLDALGLRHGLAVVTKLDLLTPDDPRRTSRPAEVTALMEGTTLAGSPVLGVSAQTGEGLAELRTALLDLCDRVLAFPGAPAGHELGGARLAIDRAFSVRGRGAVVTGTLRGGSLERGATVRIVPAGAALSTARVRELQIHGRPVERVAGSGRVALNLAGPAHRALRRGQVVATSPAPLDTERLLVELRPVARGRPLRDGVELRLHLGTDEVLCRLRLAATIDEPVPIDPLLGMLRLARPVAAAVDDRFVLRWPSPAAAAAGGRVLDPLPPRRLARRRLDATAIARIATAASVERRLAALLAAHGALTEGAIEAYGSAFEASGTGTDHAAGTGMPGGPVRLDPELAAGLERLALDAVAEDRAQHPTDGGLPRARLRPRLVQRLRLGAEISPPDARTAIEALLDGLVRSGRLAQHGDRLVIPGRTEDLPPELAAAMGRLEVLLDAPAPPPLGEAAQAAGCPPDGVRRLAADGRIVRVGDDLAYAAPAYGRLEALAMRLAGVGPLTPAALRDASGTSRKYALAILEEMDGRG